MAVSPRNEGPKLDSISRRLQQVILWFLDILRRGACLLVTGLKIVWCCAVDKRGEMAIIIDSMRITEILTL